MHSNSIGCPKLFPPSAPVLYWLSHLTCISSLKAKKKTSEKCWFSHSWKYPDTANTFSLFLDKFKYSDLRPIYCSLTESASIHSALNQSTDGQHKGQSESLRNRNYRTPCFLEFSAESSVKLVLGRKRDFSFSWTKMAGLTRVVRLL